MENQQNEIMRFLENLPEKFEILETGIDIQTQKEYLELSLSFGRGAISEKETIHLGRYLFISDMDLNAKKKALCLLAHLGTVQAYRLIEKYCLQSDTKLKSWAALALQECKMFLESSLTESNTGFVTTGLGGSGNKLRYIILVFPSNKKTFTGNQKKIIENEFTFACKNEKSIMEKIEFDDEYVSITTLIPLDTAPASVFEAAISACNENGNFVLDQYFSTNVFIPDKNEISRISDAVYHD